jgi:hypothetical protein
MDTNHVVDPPQEDTVPEQENPDTTSPPATTVAGRQIRTKVVGRK